MMCRTLKLALLLALSTSALAQSTSVPAPAASSPPVSPTIATLDPNLPYNRQHVPGLAKPPRLIKTVPPEFTDEARRQKLNGNVRLYFWVGPDGVPSHIRVVDSLGHGLDQKAVQALRASRFQPATLDGRPVTTDLYIEVNFQVF